jgi:hypothetical protein
MIMRLIAALARSDQGNSIRRRFIATRADRPSLAVHAS